MKGIAAVAAFAFIFAACGSGPAAPQPGGAEVVCDDVICLAYPGDWKVDVGEGYIGFTNPVDPEHAKASAAIVNMEAIASSAGITWPAQPEDVARAFWQLLAEGSSADLDSLVRRQGGAIETSGSLQDVVLWHLLVPVDFTHAIAVEMRGPNRSWEIHAAVFFSDVRSVG